MVVRHGRVAWFKSQGMMDREAGKAMQPGCHVSHLFHDQAHHQRRGDDALRRRRFLLDDPVSKYLPEFKNPKVLVKPATGAALHDSGNQGDHDSRSASAHVGNHLSVE